MACHPPPPFLCLIRHAASICHSVFISIYPPPPFLWRHVISLAISDFSPASIFHPCRFFRSVICRFFPEAFAPQAFVWSSCQTTIIGD